MVRINDNYLKLKAGYLFPEIARRVRDFADGHPEAKIIKLGIGDVTEPLPEAVTIAMHKAVDEMAKRGTFHGYGPDQGYRWLRDKIVEQDYQARVCDIAADEVFVSDGSKCDTGNILDILASHARGGNTIAVPDPVYPVYVDTNVMAGHTGPAASGEQGDYEGLVYLPMTPENGFEPELAPLDRTLDVIYLCYPNNPTGAVASRQTLEGWVNYAREHGSLILFDAAYEAFIRDAPAKSGEKDGGASNGSKHKRQGGKGGARGQRGGIPHSIYEIEGAKQCAIEFRSFSKTAGFTGVRCAFTVVPRELLGKTADGQDVEMHKLWARRQATKFNGVSYITQRGAEAVYSDAGREQVRDLVDFYLENARIVRDHLTSAGMEVFGGVHSPYIWIRNPEGLSSWRFFDKLLEEANVVGTPGSGFGGAGEGFFRISAFNSRENVQEAMSRIGSKLTVAT